MNFNFDRYRTERAPSPEWFPRELLWPDGDLDLAPDVFPAQILARYLSEPDVLPLDIRQQIAQSDNCCRQLRRIAEEVLEAEIMSKANSNGMGRQTQVDWSLYHIESSTRSRPEQWEIWTTTTRIERFDPLFWRLGKSWIQTPCQVLILGQPRSKGRADEAEVFYDACPVTHLDDSLDDDETESTDEFGIESATGKRYRVHGWLRRPVHESQLWKRVSPVAEADRALASRAIDRITDGLPVDIDRHVESDTAMPDAEILERARLVELADGLQARLTARLAWRNQIIRLLERGLRLCEPPKPVDGMAAYCVSGHNPEDWLVDSGSLAGLSRMTVDTLRMPGDQGIAGGNLTPLPCVHGGECILGFTPDGLCIAAGRVSADFQRWSILATASGTPSVAEQLGSIVVFSDGT